MSILFWYSKDQKHGKIWWYGYIGGMVTDSNMIALI